MKSHQEAINTALFAHLATHPAEPFDVVVAHRGDLVGVKFHEAMAEQSGRAVEGDVGVFIATRATLLDQLDAANPDVAANLRDVHPMKPTVVCFAFQGTTLYVPSDNGGPSASGAN